MNSKLLATVGTVAVLALIAGAVVLATNLGAPKPRTAIAYPTYVQTLPAGCRPVAPGAYSAICGERAGVSIPKPANGLVCHPVAPGSFTQICVPKDSIGAPHPTPAPTQPAQLVCKPVAPGAFTEICTRR